MVASVLVFAFQARELARQSRLANQVSGTRAHAEMVFHWKILFDVFVQYPELHAFYFDHTSDTPSSSESVRLKIIAEQHADWLDVALLTSKQLSWFDFSGMTGEWDAYVASTVASSSLLRSTVRQGVAGDWPHLERFVARYDASQAAPAELAG